jgi:hypothetical protein
MVEIENNFQTMNIIYKMKKIKKSKKNPRNLQNIEPLEVLENTINNPNEKNPNEKNPNEKKTNEIEENKNIKEGFDNNYEFGLQDEDFEGGDDVNSQKGGISLFSKGITDIINEIYTYIILINCNIAFSMTNSIGDYTPKAMNNEVTMEYIKDITYVNVNGNNDNPMNGGDKDLDPLLIKDSNVIYQYICLFEALLLAYLFTITWYYNIFYNYYVNKPYSNIFDYLSRDSIKENTGNFSKIVMFFFGYAFIILEDIRWFFEKFIPRICIKRFNKPFLYLLLFLLIFEFNHKFLSQFKNFLINMINSNYVSIFMFVIICIIFYEYVSSFYSVDSVDDKIKSYLEMISMNIFILLFNFIKEIIRLIIIMMFAIPLGIILCLLYFFYVCITGFFESFNQLENIIRFIRIDIEELVNPDPCNVPKTFWDYLKNAFLYLSAFVYNNLIFLIIIFYCMFVLINDMSLNGTLTMYLQLSHIPILICCVLSFLVLLGKYKVGENNATFAMLLLNPDIIKFKDYVRFSVKTICVLIIPLIIFCFYLIGKLIYDSYSTKISQFKNKPHNKYNKK